MKTEKICIYTCITGDYDNLHDVEKDEDIYAVGRVAQSQMEYLETIDYIRHPSHGGKTECVIGILSI